MRDYASCEEWIATMMDKLADKAKAEGFDEGDIDAALFTVSFARRFPDQSNDSDVDWGLVEHSAKFN